MIVDVDQSGKLEDTSVPTAVALANGHKRCLLISAMEKRKLQKIFREMNKPRLYAYRTFSILIFVLLQKNMKRIDRVVIDTEYPGYDHVISCMISETAALFGVSKLLPDVVFEQVGKASTSHLLAYDVFKKKRKPDITVTAADVLRILTK